MAKELVTKQANEVATAEQLDMLSAFDYGQVEAKDLKIPKLLLMQAMSKFVNEDGTAKAGDLVNSVTSEVYGSVREKDYSPVRVIPIHMFKQWIVHEDLGGGKLEFDSIVPVTPANTDWAWEEEVDGKKLKRVKNLSFYVLLEKDSDNQMALPHVLTFRGTSYKEGLVLADHFARCLAAKTAKIFKVPMGSIFEIGGKQEKNDKGTYYVLNAKEVGAATPEQIQKCFGWYKQVSKSNHTDVDNSDIVTDTAKEERF